MRYKLVDEFEKIYSEYQNVTAPQDRKVRLKLKEIIASYEECGIEERDFIDDIIKKFCELIELFRTEERVESALAREAGKANGAVYNDKQCPYASGDALLSDFLRYFTEQKGYPVITIKDYASKIKTFCTDKNNEYLYGIFPRDSVEGDALLFTYNNIETIIDRFDIRDENGDKSRQRQNIRAALRKLCEFRRIKDHE